MPRHPQTQTRLFFWKNKVLCKCEKLKNLSAWSNKKAIPSKHVFQFLYHLQNSNCSISDAQKRLHEWCVKFQIRTHISILCKPDLSSRSTLLLIEEIPSTSWGWSLIPPFAVFWHAKRRNFHVRSFCSSSLAASLVFTKTTALEAPTMAESRANKVPRSAFGFFSSWFRTGKWKVEVCGSLASSRTLVSRRPWECQLKLWSLGCGGSSYTWVLHARYQFISIHKIREMWYNRDV